MSRWHSYINSAKQILSLYKGDEPFPNFIKNYFAQFKKYGSTDRKLISSLCYGFFRLGHSINDLPVEERLKIGFYLCNNETSKWKDLFNPDWLEHADQTLNDKIFLVKRNYTDFDINKIFPWQNELSENIDAAAFVRSHLIQPDLFIRIRPGMRQQVVKKLAVNNIQYIEINDNCLAFSNNTKVDSVLTVNKEVVIQDYSSQRISEFLQIIKQAISNRQPAIKLWDCCAASGGKSILAVDVLGAIDLTVSDIRSSIIHNLKQRFAEAGIKNYRSLIADLTNSKSPISTSKFNVIIADVPCSGSGTWSRTPEQLYFFTEDKIGYYASLQKKIISNVIPYLAKDGFLLYITCSVFKKENEEMVDFISTNFPLQLIKQELLEGYDSRADTMFAALLTPAGETIRD